MNDTNQCYCTEYIEKDDMLKLSFENEVYSIYGKLNKGEKIILKYFGKLIPDDEPVDKQIFLNYGYGNLWADKSILEMKPCCYSDKKCYCIEIELTNVENLFFCFMDSNNSWDLNDNSSYVVAIDNPLTTLTKTTVSVTVPDEEYMSMSNRFFQKITTRLINFFAKIGNLFDRRSRA